MNFVDESLYPRFGELIANYNHTETKVGKIYYSLELSNDVKIEKLFALVEASDCTLYLNEIFKNGNPHINDIFVNTYVFEFQQWLISIGSVGIFMLDWIDEEYKLFALKALDERKIIQKHEYMIIWRKSLIGFGQYKITEWLAQKSKVKIIVTYLFERANHVPLEFIQLFLKLKMTKPSIVLVWAKENEYGPIARFVSNNYK